MMERQPSNAGGLTAPTSIGISMSELEEIQDRFNTQDRVEEDLKALGIHDASKPSSPLGEITAELLNTTDSRQYTEMYSNQLAWSNYLNPILARVSAGLLQFENQMKLIEAKIRETCREMNKTREKNEKLSADEISNEVLNDPTYQGSMLEAQKLKQYKLSLEAMAEVAGRNMKVVSRQVEIRRQDLEGPGRQENMPGRNIRPLSR